MMKTNTMIACLILLMGGVAVLQGCSGNSGATENRTEEVQVARADSADASTKSQADAAFDYSAYADVLSTYVDEQGMVDYKGLKANREKLDAFVKSMAALERSAYEAWSDDEKIAFWINAYNALTLKTIINHYPIRKGGLIASVWYPDNSIQQIKGAFDKIEHTVMDEKMTLNHIEHEILRAKFEEPRIHMALVCAALDCPKLRNEPYRGAALDEQLDDQSRHFMSTPNRFRIDRQAGVVHISEIFKWFGGDFQNVYATDDFQHLDGKLRPVINFVAKYASEEDARYLREQTYEVKYTDYDWTLNEQ